MNSMNWDDLKYFLAVCRKGSIRGAAHTLGVNHATVSRRINSFEDSLNLRLFDRTPQGYLKTRAAEELYNEASHLEERLSRVERKAFDQDNTMQGEIRITLADVLAQRLLMPDIAAFATQYPGVDIEILDSPRSFNLASREADIAIRVSNSPPEYLIGSKLADLHRAVYINRKYSEKLHDEEWLSNQHWIGWSAKMRRPIGKIAREYAKFDSKHSIKSSVLQTHACILGMGIAVLPCFIGDSEPELVRVPPFSSEKKYELWLLSHPDLRHNAKIQTFLRFIKQRILLKQGLIEGRVSEMP